MDEQKLREWLQRVVIYMVKGDGIRLSMLEDLDKVFVQKDDKVKHHNVQDKDKIAERNAQC